jgi:hypothetical protein
VAPEAASVLLNSLNILFQTLGGPEKYEGCTMRACTSIEDTSCCEIKKIYKNIKKLQKNKYKYIKDTPPKIADLPPETKEE